jgi:CheY-like chemotaxis protein/tetratricopeptide (TPR) repeat protein
VGRPLLYIDDDPQLPAGCAEVFLREGFELLQTADPEEAIRLFDQHRPALVLMELETATFDGLDLMEGIRSRGAEPGGTPIVVLSRAPRTSHLFGEAIAQGVKDFLCKPVNLTQLVESLREFAAPAAPIPELELVDEVVPEDPATAGDLAETPFCEVLRRLHRRAATGVLRAVQGAGQVEVQLRNGSPVTVRSSRGREPLEDFLLRTRRLDPEDHRRIRAELTLGTRSTRELLVEMGAISEEEIECALRRRAEEQLFEAFAWAEGRYRFEDRGRLGPEAALELERECPVLLLEGVLEAAPPVLIRDRLQQRESLYAARVESAELDGLALTPAQEELLASLDGQHTLAEILETDVFDPRLVYALWAGGWVEVHAAPTLILTDALEELEEVAPQPVPRAAAAPQTAAPPPQLLEVTDLIGESIPPEPAEEAAEPEPEPVQTEPVPEPEPVQPEPVPEPEPEPVPEPELGLEPEPEPVQTEPVPEPESIEAPAEPEPVEAPPQAKPQPRSKPQPRPKPKPRTKPARKPAPVRVETPAPSEPAVPAPPPIVAAPESAPVPEPEPQPAPVAAPAPEPQPVEAATAAPQAAPDAAPPQTKGEIALYHKPSPEEALRGTLRELSQRYMGFDDFDVLDVPVFAPDAQLRSAYEARLAQIPRAALESSDPEIRQRARRIRARIEDAYQHLKDPETRRYYAVLRQETERDRDAEESAARSLEAERCFRKGQGLLERKRYDEAVESFGMASHLDPSEGEYLAHLGYALYLNRPQDDVVRREATEHIANGIKRSPDRELSYVFLGRILRARGEVETARKVLRRALKIRPDCHPALQELRLMEMREQKGRGLLGRLLRR